MVNAAHYKVVLVAFLATMLLSLASPASAQYSLTAAPYQNANYGFYENFNLGWSVRGNGFGFSWNGGNAIPPFGPFDPNAQAQFGGGFRANGLSGGFNLTAGQGADSTLVSQTPSVTVMNGATGYFSDTTVRPFVTGIVPVVGAAGYNIPQPVMGSYYRSPLQERLARLQAQGQAANAEASAAEGGNIRAVATATAVGGGSSGPSSAERGAASVADIKAARANDAAAKIKEVAEIVAKADAYAAEGKPTVARLLYQQAARKADGDQRAQIAVKLKQLE